MSQDEPLYLQRQRAMSNRNTIALNQMLDYIDVHKAALCELMRLKRLHDRLEIEASPEFALAMLSDYTENKPKAWAAAFALIDKGENNGYTRSA